MWRAVLYIEEREPRQKRDAVVAGLYITLDNMNEISQDDDFAWTERLAK